MMAVADSGSPFLNLEDIAWCGAGGLVQYQDSQAVQGQQVVVLPKLHYAPLAITSILSASWMVESLWAMIMAPASFRASCIRRSV